MNHTDLQTELARLGTYPAAKVDPAPGICGPIERASIVTAMANGPDTPITAADIHSAAGLLGVPAAAVVAVRQVEAAGAGFSHGLPLILPEPHRFSRATAHRWDESWPTLSYPQWDPKRYPKTQADRYAQLAKMVCLDVDAGFASASYGAFQILGENWKACGYSSAWDMAHQQSLTEGEQLRAFVAFVKSKRLDAALRRLDFDAFAEGYNGTAWRLNDYGNRLRAAYRKASA